ncbi:endolytic transglycosylase MltG [Kineothrix sedimenti]|uniref:Endolytic transglycosylase MltG n=1 Tax=Kineothrix sedimenti TaxID=3123317 RepID=A0ABZ3EVR2_9FIRM
MNTKQLIGTVFDTVLKIVIIIVVVMFTYKYATDAYNFGYRIFTEAPVAEEGNAKVISIAITEEASTMDIGEVLEEKGLINDAKVFYVQELISEYHGELKPGIYELSSDMTVKEMMEIMSAEDEESGAEEVSSGSVTAEEDSNAGTEDGEAESSGTPEDDTGAE